MLEQLFIFNMHILFTTKQLQFSLSVKQHSYMEKIKPTVDKLLISDL